MTLPYYFFGLPIFIQGVLLSAFAVTGIGVFSLLMKNQLGARKLQGATPKVETTAVADKPLVETEELVEASSALVGTERSVYDVPAILRRDGKYDAKRDTQEQMMPITQRLFRESAELKARLDQEGKFFLEQLEQQVSLCRRVGQPGAIATGRRYNVRYDACS